MESLVGKTLKNSKYLIDRELGHGGFGITYKAIDLVTNEPVVIKTLKQGTADNPHRKKLKEQFIEEAGRLYKFKHSNIVRYRSFFEENGQPFIVMDYIPGSTLDEIVLPDNPLPEATAIAYIRQVAEALKVVHQNGLLHRDIKPQNLILHQETQQVILIDFGISREFSQGETRTHTNLISEGYAPIEQYLPKAKRTSAIDVYGLAATLYTLLTARVPDAPTLRDRIPLDPPRDIKPSVSKGVSDAVMKGMELEVGGHKGRPKTVDEWLDILLNPEKHSIVLASNSKKFRGIQKEVRGNLPLTAKEGSFASISAKQRIPVAAKAIGAVVACGLGIGYVSDRLERMSLLKNFPLQQESIKEKKDSKNTDYQDSQVIPADIQSDRTKELARQAEEEDKRARVAAQQQAEAEQRAEKQAREKAAIEAAQRQQELEAKRAADLELARQKEAEKERAKIEADLLERERQAEADRIERQRQHQQAQREAAARREAERQTELRKLQEKQRSAWKRRQFQKTNEDDEDGKKRRWAGNSEEDEDD